MADIASLGLKVTTEGIDKANTELSELEKNAKEAAAAADKLGDEAQDTSRQVRELGDESGKAGAKGESMTASFFKGTAAFEALRWAAGAITDTFKQAISAAAQYELVTVQLEQSLGRVGNATGMSVESLQEFAGELESATGIAEESIIQMELVINRFGKTTGKQFREVVELATDMAVALRMDPVQAAELLAKAMNDPARGIDLLRRAFEAMDPAIANSIDQMAAAGNTAEAMDAIVEMLRDKIGGAGSAQSNTLVGAWARFTDALGDASRDMAQSAADAIGLKDILNDLAGIISGTGDAAAASAAKQAEFAAQLRVVGLAAAAVTGNLANYLNVLSAAQRAQASAGNDQGVKNLKDFGAAVEGVAVRTQNWLRGIRDTVQMNDRVSNGMREQEALTRSGSAAVALKQRQDAEVAKWREDAVKRGTQLSQDAEQEIRRSIASQQAYERSVTGGSRALQGRAQAQSQVARATDNATKAVQEYIDALRLEGQTASMTEEEQAAFNAELRVTEMLTRDNVQVTQDYIDEMVALARQAALTSKAQVDAAEKAKQALEDQERAVQDIIGEFSNFFESIVSGSDNALEALGKLILKLIEMQLQMQLMNSMGGGSGGFDIFGTIGSFLGLGGPSLMDAAYAYPAFSKGAAFDRGVVTMARGHMVDKPTTREMALMGEQGPEAVLPLTRDGQGNLGVRGGSGGGDVKVVVQNIDQRKNGAPVETEQSRGQNGQLMIRNYIRDEVKRAFGEGAMDKDMARNFNVSRSPVRRS